MLFLGIWLGLPVCLTAADEPDAQRIVDGQASDVIRVSTNLVSVPVSVTNVDGVAVDNLDMKDFLIEEDGRQEAILKIAGAGQAPLQLALILDLSGSMNPRFEFERNAAIRFLEKVWEPGDSVSIISIGDRPQVRLRASRSLTEALQVLAYLRPTRSSTSFFDTVVLSAHLLRQTASKETRQSEIVLSDGEDNQSDCGLPDALREVQLSDTMFYAINPGGTSIRLNEISIRGQEGLASLAAKTGGAAFVADKTTDLDGIFSRIAAELRAQYLLSYYSSNSHSDGRFRQIAVSIPNRPDLRVRARQGYFAAQK